VTTVLICDDSMFARQMTRRMVESAGCTVIAEAEDGEQAIEKYESLQPGLLMVDLVMPRMGGLDAIRRIIAKQPEARIVVCSAMGQEGLVQQALDAGAKGFVVKPAKAEAIKTAVADALR
jgi:two-component system chemotaxis response regulator CheY